MLRFERLNDRKILIITTDGPLEETDFKEFAKHVEADSEAQNRPTRLMIRTESFPGWESFEAFVAHLKFVSEHHRQIERIAIVTDSGLLKLMPHIAGLLVHPKIRQFDLAETDAALAWLESGSQ
jgi:stage II sporulation SpoAA-like protein